ncbi:zinc-dependent alcohol dehydrogenase [Oricola sp.]|uniref:zinc-dependent alcohol dehydrogenase n=1 Tax=Oricola sp. TaxID=1979950 RepID=UPI003BA91DBD
MTMHYNAVEIRGPDDFGVRSFDGEAPAPGEVAIAVEAVGVCGTDIEIVDGTMPYFTSGAASYPIVPGHEWVGRVVEAGAGVTRFVAGDRVVGECSVGCMRCHRCMAGLYHQCANRTETGILNRSGGFSERIVFPELFLHPISEDVSLNAAALVEPTAIAFNGVKKASVSPRDRVAVFGDGPIGLLLMMVAKAFGARSVAVVGATKSRLAHAVRLGADLAIDVTAQDPRAQLLEYGDGSLPDVVLEATGNPAAVPAAIEAAAPGGRVVLQGLFAGGKVRELCFDHLVVNDISLLGALGSPGIWPDVIALIESGEVDPAAIVTHELALDQFGEGIRLVKAREALKVIVRP